MPVVDSPSDQDFQVLVCSILLKFNSCTLINLNFYAFSFFNHTDSQHVASVYLFIFLLTPFKVLASKSQSDVILKSKATEEKQGEATGIKERHL